MSFITIISIPTATTTNDSNNKRKTMKSLQQLLSSSDNGNGSRKEATTTTTTTTSHSDSSPTATQTIADERSESVAAAPLFLNEQQPQEQDATAVSSSRSSHLHLRVSESSYNHHSDASASVDSSVNNDSNHSTSTAATTATVKSQKLHNNLMRCQKRDPHDIYKIIRELGRGSMGSVQMVQKKEAAMGGSARKGFAQTAFMTIKRPTQNHCSQTETLLLNKVSETIHEKSPTQTSNANANAKTLFHQASSLVDSTKRSTQYYALKSLHLDQCSNEQLQKELQNEVEILKTLDHPHIARALETFEFQGSLYLCLELCSGGDLYSRDPYTEYQAAQILYSLTSAVRYLHAHGIIHRDLKYENCMFTSNFAPVEDIKLIDFGLSQKFTPEFNLKDPVGTIYTMAPELLAGDYNEKADVWSIGVMAFMLLSSSMPFYGKDRTQVIKRICRGKVQFKAKGWNNKSNVCKHLVHTLLNKHVDQRPNSEEALAMIREWRDSFEEAQDDIDNNGDYLQLPNESGNVEGHCHYGASDRSCNTTTSTTASSHISNDSTSLDSSSRCCCKSNAAHNMLRIQASIHAFAQYTTLKKLALMIIAYKATSGEIGFLRYMFETYFDVSQNGEMGLDEYAAALEPFFHYTSDEIEALFQAMDVDGSGIVHYIEFLAATIESHGTISKDCLADAFDRMDCDDSGYIELENLQDLLGDDIPLEYLERIVEEADILKDKKINYEEFLQLWNRGYDQVLEDAKNEALRRQKQSGLKLGTFRWSFASSIVSGSSGVEESLNDDYYATGLKDDDLSQEQPVASQTLQHLSDHMKTPTTNNTSAPMNSVECFKIQKALSIRNSWH